MEVVGGRPGGRDGRPWWAGMGDPIRPSSLCVSIQGKPLKPRFHAGSGGVKVDGGTAAHHFPSTYRSGGRRYV